MGERKRKGREKEVRGRGMKVRRVPKNCRKQKKKHPYL